MKKPKMAARRIAPHLFKKKDSKRRNVILEAIVTSIDKNNSPHIAPFGVRERDGLVLISPFQPSVTLDNLLRSRCAVLNLTDDVRVFAGALTGRRSWPVHKAEKVDGFVLDCALAHRELELVEVVQDDTRPELSFQVVHEANHSPFCGFNRAQAAVVELSILVSRLNRLPMEKIEAEIAYLTIALEKTAGAREREAWDWLVEYVENHKAAARGENIA